MQNSGLALEKRNKIPTPGHNLPGLNDKISVKKEHNSIRAVSLQIFHDCPFDISFIVGIKYPQVFTQQLRLILQ